MSTMHRCPIASRLRRKRPIQDVTRRWNAWNNHGTTYYEPIFPVPVTRIPYIPTVAIVPHVIPVLAQPVMVTATPVMTPAATPPPESLSPINHLFDFCYINNVSYGYSEPDQSILSEKHIMDKNDITTVKNNHANYEFVNEGYNDSLANDKSNNANHELIDEGYNDTLANDNKYINGNTCKEKVKTDKYPLESYYKLPANLFRNPKHIKLIDPNLLIDAFCSLDVNITELNWILDLELGHPKNGSNRNLASYDVHLCTITSRESPGTVHPGFAKCSEYFRQQILFHYDVIISSWYLGFVSHYNDMSVLNFQNWLTPIMNESGISWCKNEE